MASTPAVHPCAPDFGAKLRAARQAKNLTIDAAAAAAEIRPTRWQRLETTTSTRAPGFDAVVGIARALKLPLNVVMAWLVATPEVR